MSFAVNKLIGFGARRATGQASVDQITNHTSASSASGASAASTETVGYEAWQGFDGVVTGASGLWFATTTTGWLRYQFNSAKIITRYDLTGVSSGYGVNRSPYTWTFEGSADASSWTTLDTETAIVWTSNQTRQFTIASPASFTYYRLNVSAIDGGTLLGVQELRLIGY